MKSRYRVIVCGTRFGEHYLAALTHYQQDDRYQLTGILASGSERSTALAMHLQVPLYTTIDDIPADTDIACVVVRSRIVGGAGSDIARALLLRGISVLQEHPVHPTDTQRLYALARQQGVRYHINTLYPYLPAGHTFINYALQSAARSRPAFIEITTSLQLLYSALDIAGRALGALSPFACTAPLALDGLSSVTQFWPFRSLQGTIAGVPLAMHLQNELDPADPDHHSLVMHRIAIGGAEGNVCLVGSFGPVVWSHSLYAPQYERNDRHASWLLAPERFLASHHNHLPSALTLGPAVAPDLIAASRHDIPHAILAALDELTATTVPSWQQDNHWQHHGEAWLGIMHALGKPVLRTMSEPRIPFPDPVAYARQLQTDSVCYHCGQEKKTGEITDEEKSQCRY